MPDLPAARYRELIDHILALCDERPAIRAKNPRHLVLLATLELEAVETARATLLLVDSAHSGACAPLVRKVFEFGVVSQWIYITGKGVDAFYSLADLTGHQLVSEMREAAVPVPADVFEMYPNPGRLPSEAQVLRRFKQVCESFGDSAGLYVIYRHLSGGSHPSTDTTSRWLRRADSNPTGLEFQRAEPPPVHTLLHPLLAGLLWCARAVDEQTKYKPRKNALKAIAGEAGISSLLKPVTPH